MSLSSASESGEPIIWRTSAGFVDAVLRDEPARAARDAKEQARKSAAGTAGDAELPAPRASAQVHQAGDDVVGEVGEQDSDDDVDLEEADQAAAPFSRGELGDVDRAEDGGAADAEAADEAEAEQGRPVPGEARSRVRRRV